MRRKRKIAGLVSVAIAGGLVILLLIAGTVLRMNTGDMGALEAFCSFVKDTFNFNPVNAGA